MVQGARSAGPSELRVVYIGCSVARLGRARGRHRGTRRLSHLGSTFLTGVDRRVQAPLGTVINFSALLISASSPRRGGRFIRVVRGGGRLLLRLVSSILSLTGVRSNVVRLGLIRISLQRLYGRLIISVHVGMPTRITLYIIPSLPSCVVHYSGIELARVVSGFVGGTVGRADGKAVLLNCRVH